MSLLRNSDLLWRFSVDLRRLRSVWPDAPADVAITRPNELWCPRSLRLDTRTGKLVANPDAPAMVHVGSGTRAARRADFMDEDDPLLDQLGRAREIDQRLHAAGTDAFHVLAMVFGRRMPEWRSAFGEHIQHGDGLRGTGSLAHLAPDASGVRLERLGRTLLRGRASADEGSVARAIARWCDARLVLAMGRYAGRERSAA